MFKFVIIRHGLTEWSNRFTGWTDIDLAPQGIEETKKYGLKLKELGYSFDLGFTSVLKRGVKTLEIVLKVLGQENVPIIKDCILTNETMEIYKDKTRLKRWLNMAKNR